LLLRFWKFPAYFWFYVWGEEVNSKQEYCSSDKEPLQDSSKHYPDAKPIENARDCQYIL